MGLKNKIQRSVSIIIFSSLLVTANAQINRQALVERHKVIVTTPDTLASLTVGNGSFAFTTDITGLQSFPDEYKRGIPLGTQSEWGWHSFIDTADYKREEALKQYHLNGRDISYTVQWNSPERNKAAGNWFRQNPHRLQLGTIGFEIIKKDGTKATISDLTGIHQELNPWTGEIKSHFAVEGIPVDVNTYGHGKFDLISVKVKSPLLKEGRIRVSIRFPYPTGEWTDAGANWVKDQKHQSRILNVSKKFALISHVLDSTDYSVALNWSGASIKQSKPHYFIVTPSANLSEWELSAEFIQERKYTASQTFAEVKKSSELSWKKFWTSGGAIDFSGSSDPRANELERRIILSQYLLRVQEAGSFPPQETGLTYNSWFGKPHLEMHWWHSAQYAFWGRTDIMKKSMNWYFDVSDNARKIAKRQGFDGLRWQKMTDHAGTESPSSVGAFLIWQQPHFIYFAEMSYRDKQSREILDQYKKLVFETADFMASFPYYDSATKRYILGKGLIPAQERFKAEETFNPTYELVYWKWALNIAQQWRIRSGLPREKKWDDVLKHLSLLPVQDNKYLFTESAKDSYTNPEFRTDHPAVLGAFGMMPATGQVDRGIMKNTFDWIWDNWAWKDTWGWDFPLVAMTATRLGMPDKAIDALLMGITTNTYLPNGHNYQDDRLRLYLPGNGALLAAIAMMCAGYDDSKEINPGIPKNGKWKVKWEGLKKMP